MRGVGAVAMLLSLGLACAPVQARSFDSPLPPVDVEAAVTAAGIVVSWSPPLYDGGHPILSYTVFRMADPLHPAWEEIGSTDATTTSWIDAGSGVLYAVTASNEAGPSPQSEPASAGSMTGCYPVVVQLSPFGWGINKDCLPVDIQILVLDGGS